MLWILVTLNLLSCTYINYRTKYACDQKSNVKTAENFWDRVQKLVRLSDFNQLAQRVDDDQFERLSIQNQNSMGL